MPAESQRLRPVGSEPAPERNARSIAVARNSPKLQVAGVFVISQTKVSRGVSIFFTVLAPPIATLNLRRVADSQVLPKLCLFLVTALLSYGLAHA